MLFFKSRVIIPRLTLFDKWKFQFNKEFVKM